MGNTLIKVCNSKGFVLIELLVAIAILSVVFFYLIPATTKFFINSNNNKNVEELNRIVRLAYKKSRSTGLPQKIWGLKGSTNIHFGNKLFYLKDEVFDAKINEKYQVGDKYAFFVYPDGVMDKVVLIFSSEKRLISKPLLLRFF